MKIKNLFARNKQEGNDELELSNGFVLGIEDKFALNNSNDVIVVGTLSGSVSVNDAVYISNIGDDNDSVLLTTVLAIEVNHKKVKDARNCPVALCLSNCKELNIRCGSTVYTRDITIHQVHDAYITALANTYIIRKNMELTSQEIEGLSIVDSGELWSMYARKLHEAGGISEDARRKIDAVAKSVCAKILDAPSIYCVFSKTTEEPYMKSSTYTQDDSYVCTPPDIVIIPKAYKDIMSKVFTNDLYLKEIVNGDDKKGIYNFLGRAFYTNGACGIIVFNDNVAINNTMIVEKPDLSNLDPINIPVTNPDVVRWLILMGQLQELDSEDKKLIYSLYVGHMNRALLDAKFIVPMKHNNKEVPDENNKVTFTEGTTMTLSLSEGKNGRKAVNLYTDWDRLYQGVGQGWDGLIQTVSELINSFDCVINKTQYIKTACYISKETYDSIKKD